MALTTSRMSVVRGRPPGLTAGMSGSSMVHAVSVRSVGERCDIRCPPPQVPRGPTYYHANHLSDRLSGPRHSATSSPVLLRSQRSCPTVDATYAVLTPPGGPCNTAAQSCSRQDPRV